MKGFALDSDGDVIVKDDIAMVSDTELLRQTVECVIATNKGEWKYDIDEGVDFSVILTKNPNEDRIRDEIRSALGEVDSSYHIDTFTMNRENRKLTIRFVASNGQNTIEGGYSYA